MVPLCERAVVYEPVRNYARSHHRGRAVVGAGSAVLHDVPDWKVVVGAPAKVVKERPRTKLNDKERAV